MEGAAHWNERYDKMLAYEENGYSQLDIKFLLLIFDHAYFRDVLHMEQQTQQSVYCTHLPWE